MKQEHRTPAGTSREELFSGLEKTFALEGWKHFLAANRERYPRYWREQCAGLSALVGQVDDTEILSEALQMCLDCDTLTASNLADTYRHLLEQRHHTVVEQYVTPFGQAPGSRGPVERPKISVQGRSLDYYSAAVTRQAQEVSHE